MYKILIFIFLIILNNALYSQEKLIPLTINPEIQNNPQTNKNDTTYVYFLLDTLELNEINPHYGFTDDFSTNLQKQYDTTLSYYQISDSIAYTFFTQGGYPDSIRYMTETSWDYFYNSTTQQVDSTPQNYFLITWFSNPDNPFQPFDVDTVWPTYYHYSFDLNTGNIIDSVLDSTYQTAYQNTIPYRVVSFDTNALWTDSYAFINQTYAVEPITVGTATLDGLDETGYPYNFTFPDAYGIADYLTSKPINLDYNPEDSLYLSFYYQPQGLGNDPQKKDSLVLEFLDIETANWEWQWSTTGKSLDTFRLVMLPIIKTKYLKKGFRFRFKNYATLSGSLDHWHIDYVRLNKNRTITDTALIDIGFVNQANPLINTFSSMPQSHFAAAPTSNMPSEIPFTIHNNRIDFSDATVHFKYQVKENNTLVEDPPINAYSVPYQTYYSEVYPISYVFAPSSSDSSEFEVIYSINTEPDNNKNNDTIKYYQKFYNYYAYDDGTAEAAYGVTPADGRAAYQFTPKIADTLRGVQIFFNPLVNNTSGKPFYLCVWADNAGQPGDIIFISDTLYTVQYTEKTNQFAHYLLDTTLILSETFYVGWIQPGAGKVNIGFDMNFDSSDKIFYNIDGNWYNTIYKGSLMLRPMFGDTIIDYTAIKTVSKKTQPLNLSLYPNPCTDILYIKNIIQGEYNYEIYTATGCLIQQNKLKTMATIAVNHLPKGIYILKLYNSETQITKQFIKL